MGFLGRRLGHFTMSGEAYPDHDDYWYRAAEVLGSGRVGPISAMRLSAVNACVNLIATATAGLPLKLMRRTENGGSEPAWTHPLWEVLHDQPNQWQTGFEYRRMSTSHLALRGNAVSEIVPGMRGAVDQLIPIHPDRVSVERLPSGRLLYHVAEGVIGSSSSALDRYRTEGRTLEQDEVFHLRDYTEDELWGASRIMQAAGGIKLSLDAEAYARAQFRNGGEASLALKSKGRLNKTQKKELLSDWLAAHGGGPDNQGKPTVLEGDMSIEKLSLTNLEAQFLELRQFQLGDIARLFLVPPHLIGDVTKESSWGTGIEQMNIAFLTFTLMPWLLTWEQAIRRDLILQPNTYFAKHAVEGLLRADTESQYDALMKATGRPFVTVDEARMKLDMQPMGGDADTLFIPANLAGNRGANDKTTNGATNGAVANGHVAEAAA